MSKLTVLDEAAPVAGVGIAQSGSLSDRTRPHAGTVYFVTLGCAKNQVDSEVMLGQLVAEGYQAVAEPERADVIVVNTCAFLNSAVEEGIDTILELSEHRTEGRCRRLLVAGCMVERYGEELRQALPEVDTYLTTDQLLHVRASLDGEFASEVAAAGRPYFLYDETMPRLRSGAPATAYVKVAEGCDRPCSFCIIPKLRGAFRSREPESIVREAQMLLSEGVRELVLVAQDLTAYGSDRAGGQLGSKHLRDLLISLSSMRERFGEYWVRLLYAYPIGVDQALMRLIEEEPALCSYLDLPLQHISKPVLKAMRRPLGERNTRALIEQMRCAAPEVALRTTFIVGFPGETEADVAALEAFVAEGHFAHVGVFAYSQEEEADSFSYAQQVPEEVGRERQGRIMAAQQKNVLARNAQLLGTRVPVLLEGAHAQTDLLLSARTQWQAPEVDGAIIVNEFEESLALEGGDLAGLRGRFGLVELEEVAGYDLVGRLVEVAESR